MGCTGSDGVHRVSKGGEQGKNPGTRDSPIPTCFLTHSLQITKSLCVVG